MQIVRVLLMISFCFLSVGAQTNPLTPMVTENGFITLSLDAVGTNDAAGASVQVNKPLNATVRKAYLIAASTGMSSTQIANGDITIDGASFNWNSSVKSSISSWNYWAEITSLVKSKIDASAAGLINFLIRENNSTGIDGEILAVIFDDPNQTDRNTIVLFFGAQNVAGDDFYIRFAQPINLADPKLRLDFSLGIGFGFQSSGQYSIIDVNGKRLTTSAGGQDDGISDNGGLITVGGIGDVNTNPSNPNATPTDFRDDDELYNLIPYVAQGDTITHIYSQNPSNDDNIFFAALFSSVTSIVGEGILLTPDVDTNFVGTRDTLTAKVQNILGVPVVGRKVVFEILSGPHAGLKDSSVTNSLGNAIFTYTGVSIGQDEIIARTTDASGHPMSSNLAYHFWKRASTNNPPTTNPVTISNPNSTTPTIGWHYSDIDGNPQTQYEVEVWTGTNGSGSNLWNPAVGSGITTSVIYAGSPLTNGQTYYARVRAHDGTIWGAWSEANWVASLDILPIANAGPDQSVQASTSCNASVTLNGTGSSDPDGGAIVTYTWNGPGGPWTGATPAVTLPVGKNKIILTILDNEGSSAIDSVIITVIDHLGPVPTVTTLPVLRSLCSITVTPPTAVDNCTGTVNGTTPDSLIYTTQGTRTIHWTYTDANGNISTQTQTVIVKDTIPPSPKVIVLPNIQGECSVTVSTIPEALDVCAGTITATTISPLSYTTQGTYTINWVYNDKNGNTSTQTQTVIVKDNTAPVPKVATLPVIQGECSATVSIIPEALDACAGTIPATTTSPLSYSVKGTYVINWVYNDGNGNASTQTQTVIVTDNTAPVPKVASLPIVQGECSVTITTPPEALDNCMGTIIATTSDPLAYSVQGTYEINWIYDDKNGNTTTQKQQVIIDDITKPVAETPSLPVIRGDCAVELTRPYATDNCAGRIPGSTPNPLTINHQGSFTIVWSYDDGNGQILTQNQTVIIKDSIAPVLVKKASDTVIIVNEHIHSTIVHIDSAIFADNCTKVQMRANRSDGLPLDSSFFEGLTIISWIAFDTNGNCDSAIQKVTITCNKTPELTVPADTSIIEGQNITLKVLASDPDGTVPDVFMENCPVPHVFTDNKNGTATIEFRPGCSDHGIFNIRVGATDKIDTVQKVFVLKIDDVNFDPVFDNQDYYIAYETMLFNLTFKVNDCDGTVPEIRVLNNPQGANFTDNRNGTATLTWTPDADDNGYYMIIFEAKDDHTTVRDTIIVEVRDNNVYPPVLTLSATDTTCPYNHLLIINAIAKDQDGTPPVVKATGIPSGASFNVDNQGNGVFSWTPHSTGVFTFIVTANDLVDSTISVSATVTVRVTDENVSGPAFIPHPDVVIDQNQRMELTVEAIDPDGTIPVLSVGRKPQGVVFTDNRNGSGTIVWQPACDVSGIFAITTYATDGRFSDSLTIKVNVRDINCAPVLFGIPDINAQFGELIRFEVKAYDPDHDSGDLLISASCDLPGFSFISDRNGSGMFHWQAGSSSGSYPVKFYVTDGLLMDSIEMHINIDKTSSVKISGYPAGVKIYAMSSSCYNGEYLGMDSVTFCALPGTYTFQMQLKGYRPEHFTCNVKVDTTINVSRTLKPVIPRMFTPAETLVTQSGKLAVDGSFSLADLNGDGIIDISSWTHNKLSVHLGTDTGSLIFRSDPITLIDSIINISPFYHVYVDWDNDRKYDCLYSDNVGNVLVINLKNISIDTILKLNETRVYPAVYDVDNDLRKDLVVLSEGKGLFVYLNSGTDSLPVFQIATECTDSSGRSLVSMQGPFALTDIDGNENEDFIVRENGSLRIFKIDGHMSKLAFSEELNCAGERYTADSTGVFMLGSSRGMPVMIVRNGNHLLYYSTGLSGDVNGDKKVDILDIGRISKNWQTTVSDSNWNPLFNLKLSTGGSELIDIKDLSRASKCWEMHE